jgi:hypothetical protein
MRRLVLILVLAGCSSNTPEERYGFIARLGNDTLSVESVTRTGNSIVSDEVDRFPRVRQRHTEIDLNDDGSIRRLVMDVHTPSEPENERQRRVEVNVSGDSVRITKRDGTGTKRMSFATGGAVAMAHLPQMYSLYDLYFAAAHNVAKKSNTDTAKLRQFYIDREFDRFPLHRGTVRFLPGGKAEIRHDWLSGTGDATVDSSGRLLAYSGGRTTYKVDVERLAEPPDVKEIGDRFAAAEAKAGAAKQLSVRDTLRAVIGNASFTVDYGRPMARGRDLLGNVLPYDRVWRTGANAATQFTTSAPITIAGIPLSPGTYTLWTIPRANGADLIVNEQTGQWGTGYNAAHNIGTAAMTTDITETPVEKFTISIRPNGADRGELLMEWGTFRWSAPIVL